MLSKLKKTFHYSFPDLTAIAVLWILLIAAEIHIKILPASRVIERLKKKSLFSSNPPAERFNRLLELTEIADRQFGLKPHCLRKAIALKWIADFLRVPTEFKIGVARDAEGLHAHGWLECNGRRLESKPCALPFAELS